MSESGRNASPTPLPKACSPFCSHLKWCQDFPRLAGLCQLGFKLGFVPPSLCSGGFAPRPMGSGRPEKAETFLQDVALFPLVNQSRSCPGAKAIEVSKAF